MVQILRNNFIESLHFGSAAVIGSGRTVVEWGDVDSMIFPRSALKIIQAVPLLDSGAANYYGLGSQQIAISCSSHQGSVAHTSIIDNWLKGLDLSEKHLKCGVQPPSDRDERIKLINEDKTPSQLHNNCSGKHAAFLTFAKHQNLDFNYNDVRHPLQEEIRQVLEELTDERVKTFGVDGCSAPNFRCSIKGLAYAMYSLTDKVRLGKIRTKSVELILKSMKSHPFLVAGAGRACTELMTAIDSLVIVKTGAEGVFVAVLPEKKIGVAIKIYDGSTRAAEAAITLILIRLGVLSKEHPAAKKRLFSEIKNWRGQITGFINPTDGFWELGKKLI